MIGFMSSDKSMFDARHPSIGGCDERQGLGLGETGTALQLRRHQEANFSRYCYPVRFSTFQQNRPIADIRSGEGPKGALMAEWYFVWVEGLRGPVPQKWSSDGLWGQIGRQDVIVRFSLTDREAELPLDELARLHPIPVEK